MIVYRTISISEFIEVLLGKKIVGRTQKSRNCYEIIDNKIISMSTLQKSCLCGFIEPLFYNGYKFDNIMIKLDISNKEMINGYGDYFSPLFNHYLEGDPWTINSEFGPNKRFRGIIRTRIPEIHFSDYDITNVIGVYFPYHIKICTELGYVDNCNDNPFDLGDFIHRYYRRLVRFCRKEYQMKFSPRFEYLDCLPFNMSMAIAKKVLKEELITNEVLHCCKLPINDILRVIDCFSFYSGKDLSAKLDKPNTLNHSGRTIDFDTFSYLLKDINENNVFLGDLKIKELPCCDNTNKKFLELYRDFLMYVEKESDLLVFNEEHEKQSFFVFIKSNEEIVKNLFFWLCVDSKVI